MSLFLSLRYRLVPASVRRRAAVLERARCGRARGVGAALEADVADPGGVPRLDRVDRDRRGQVRLGADLGQLLLVGADRQVLERDRGRPERLRVVGGAAEVEARLLDRVAAQRLLERLDVGALVAADDGGLLLEPAVQRADALGLGVEGGLRVLERQREVEDRDVVPGIELPLLGFLAARDLP